MLVYPKIGRQIRKCNKSVSNDKPFCIKIVENECVLNIRSMKKIILLVAFSLLAFGMRGQEKETRHFAGIKIQNGKSRWVPNVNGDWDSSLRYALFYERTNRRLNKKKRDNFSPTYKIGLEYVTTRFNQRFYRTNGDWTSNSEYAGYASYVSVPMEFGFYLNNFQLAVGMELRKSNVIGVSWWSEFTEDGVTTNYSAQLVDIEMDKFDAGITCAIQYLIPSGFLGSIFKNRIMLETKFYYGINDIELSSYNWDPGKKYIRQVSWGVKYIMLRREKRRTKT